MSEVTKILRIEAVQEITGLSKSTLSRLEKVGLFPARRRIGLFAVGWIESEVTNWVSTRARTRGAEEGDIGESGT